MIDFEDKTNALNVEVFPFPNINTNRFLGIDVLESSNRCYHNYNVLAEVFERHENGDESINDEIIGSIATDLFNSVYDNIQASVNILVGVLGNDIKMAQDIINISENNVINRNAAHGIYGQQEEENIQGEEELTNDGSEGGSA